MPLFAPQPWSYSTYGRRRRVLTKTAVATIAEQLIAKNGAAQASVTGITIFIYKTVPAGLIAPDKIFTSASTDGSGNLNLDVTDLSLASGDAVWMVAMKDGSPALATARKIIPTYS